MMVSFVPFYLCYTITAVLPVSPQEAGLIPLSNPIMIYPLVGIYNGSGKDKQIPQIAIVNNETIAVAWKDDDADIGAGWMLLSPQGKPLTHEVRGVLRPDGKPTALNGMHYPHLAPMPDGKGFLLGVTYADWPGIVNPANRLLDWQNVREDTFPYLQRVKADGSFLGTGFFAFSEDFLKRSGNVRLSDIGYLSNGNILVLAEDQQERDGAELFGLPNARRTVVASLLNPEGKLLRGPVCLQTTNFSKDSGAIWYGLGIGDGKFGVRYETDQVKIRFFDNNLNPLTPELNPDKYGEYINDGGRGDRVGWHGNGKDQYLAVTPYSRNVYAFVFNSHGEDSGKICLDSQGFCGDRGDGAIDPDGNCWAVWEYHPINPLYDTGHSGIVIRRFDPQGNYLSPICYISSVRPEEWVVNDRKPRMSLRSNLLAITWLDRNIHLNDHPEVMVRVFRIAR